MSAKITFPAQDIVLRIRIGELSSHDYPKYLLVRGEPGHWLVCDTGCLHYGWDIKCEGSEEAAEIVSNMNSGTVTEAQAVLLSGASKWQN